MAQRVLDGFDELLGSFVKVFPADYKRVLAQLAAEEAANAAATNGAAPVAGATQEVRHDG